MLARGTPFLPLLLALSAACAEPESDPSEPELTQSAALGVRKCANGPMVEGIDVSHYQSDGSFGANNYAQAARHFVVHGRSEGRRGVP